MDTIKLSKLYKILEKVEQNTETSPEELDITFEFICASLYPDIFNNIKDKIMQSYIEGYNAAREEKEELTLSKNLPNILYPNIKNITNYINLSIGELANARRKLSSKDDEVIANTLKAIEIAFMDIYVICQDAMREKN